MPTRKQRRSILIAFLFTTLISGVILITTCAVYTRLRTGPKAAASASPARTRLTFQGPLVQLAWFYKPPQDGNLALLAQYFDFFILTKNDEPARDSLRTLGVTTPFLRYLRFDAILDPGSCNKQPFRNQVADQIGDFCEISANHPDWFLLDQNGNRMVNESGYAMMDPGHPGWRAFWLQRTRENQEQLGWEGIFLDNVEASLSKRKRAGQLPAAYPDQETYQAAIRGFLHYIYTGYFQPNGRPLHGNIIELKDNQVWFDYLPYLDGAMLEAWAVDWHDGYLSRDKLEAQMELAEETQAQGKTILLIAQGDFADGQRQQFAYAAYLLVSWGKASFRYTLSDHYNETWLYQNYAIDLGTPLGPRYLDKGVWKRDFASGSVWLDPAAHTSGIEPKK